MADVVRPTLSPPYNLTPPVVTDAIFHPNISVRKILPFTTYNHDFMT